MNPLSRDGITRMSPSERLALIGELWDSMTDADLGGLGAGDDASVIRIVLQTSSGGKRCRGEISIEPSLSDRSTRAQGIAVTSHFIASPANVR